MILDSELIMSGTKASGAAATVGQAIMRSTSPTNGTYDIDTLAAGDAIKSGAILHVLATEIFAGTATTVTITLTTATDAAFTSPVTLWSSGAIAKASTVAGTVLAEITIPPTCLRYLRIVYTADANHFETTGACAAWIDLNIEKTLDALK